MRILYLHGLNSHPNGTKATFLRQHGHEVYGPVLPPMDFNESVRLAQAALAENQPDVVVGSSRGGAVAMNMNSKQIPLVLIAPAWNWNGMAMTVKDGTIILHSRQDEVVPLEHSRQLAEKSGLPPGHLIIVGQNHRMIDQAALDALLEAVERSANTEK